MEAQSKAHHGVLCAGSLAWESSGDSVPPSRFPCLSAKGWIRFCSTHVPSAGHTWALHPCLPLPNPTRYHRPPRANSSSAAPSLPPRGTPLLHCLSKVTLQPQEVPQTYPGHLSPSQLLAWGVAHSWLYKHAWHGSCLLHQGGGGKGMGLALQSPVCTL